MRKLFILWAIFVFLSFAPVSYAATIYSETGAGGECCELSGFGGTDEAYSQVFTIGSDFQLTTADIWAASQGGADNLVMRIYLTSLGLPTGSPLYSSTGANGFASGSVNSQSVAFSDVCLAAGTYVFTIERTGARDTVNNWVLAKTAGSGMGYSASGVWASSGLFSLKSALYGDDVGTCPTPPVEPDFSATSTVDQAQQTVGTGFLLYLLTMFFVVWSFKKRT